MKIVLQIFPEHDIPLNLEAHHQGDAGFNLVFPETLIIPGKAIGFKVNLKVHCCMADEYHEFHKSGVSHGIRSYYLYPRSSITNTPLRLANSVGIIDAGYSGNLIVKLDNLSDLPVEIKSGESLFQICSGTLNSFDIIIVDSIEKLHNYTMSRKDGGFGSTTGGSIGPVGNPVESTVQETK